MKQAFTLIELLVVILIIGILSAIALPQYQKAVNHAKFVQMIVYNNAFVKAQKSFYLANNVYASNNDDLDIGFPPANHVQCVLDPGGILSLCSLTDKNDRFIAVLQEYLNDGRQICCSYPMTNYIADNLCSLEMGTKEWYNGCRSERPCHCYLKQ